MRFKSLELLGFKSFADKTKLSFQSGITAIVGPNGCGKSNIMDAIRWSLGEQSAKGLRGDKMEDVIFNGCSQRKPLGMAEVTLKLLNNGSLPVDYKEVQITRRLYRSGESEYLLNKNICRLKDITNLFLDTGMGHQAYSLVQQGKVDFLLSSKPIERRALLEEAAGVMKYKTRKKETLAKLELTRQNLLRISDITAEVKCQLESLKKQANKAKRYKKLVEEEQSLTALLACRQYLDCHERIKTLKARHEQVKDSQLANTTKLTQLDTEKETAELELLRLRENLNFLQKTKHQQDMEQKSAYDRIRHLREMLAEQGVQHAEAEKEIQALQQQLNQAKENQQSRQKALLNTEEELVQRKTRLQKEESGVKTQDNLVLKQRKLVDEQKNRVLRIESQLIQLRNRLQHLQNEEQKLEARRQNLESEQKRLEAEQIQLKQKLAEINKKQARQEKALRETTAHNLALQQQTDAKIQELRELDKKLAALRERHGLKSSHLASLKNLRQNLEGFQEGVRRLLLAEPPLPGLLGLVADLIETEPEYELAIETVLGPRLEYILTVDQNNAVQAVKFLREKGLGRGSFIPAGLGEIATVPFPETTPGLIGPALELVKYEQKNSLLAQHLLGSVWLAEDLDSALTIWRKAGPKPTIVTLHGEIIEAGGIVSGGSASNEKLGFLTRKRKLKELEKEVNKLAEELTRATRTRKEIVTSLENLNKQRKEGAKDQHQMEIELVAVQKDNQRWQAEKQRQAKQSATLAMEAQNMRQDRQSLAEEKTVITEEQNQSAQTKEDAHELLLMLQEQGQEREQRLNAQNKQLTEHKVKLASLEAKRESIASDIARLGAEQKQLAQKIARRKEQKEKNQGKQTEIGKEISGLQEKEKTLLLKNQDMADELLASETAYQEKTNQVRTLESSIKSAREEYNKTQKHLAEMEVQLATLKAKLEESRHRIEPSGGSIAQLSEKFNLKSFDPREARQKIEKNRNAIVRLGAVNLMALEEVQALQERYDFLVRQYEDLSRSSKDLHQAINKINHTTRERFRKTFDEVNEKFKHLCGLLFEGGEGELRLEEGEDLLECGIEIMIRPVGKRLRQMSLLSGGEKTMAAIAFLFSIYLVKPSPLCFLDEVDAALDEANVQRLLNIIKTMTGKSQFVMITHNRKTMEQADLLYGITMETPGISKLVSVKFDKQGADN